MHEHRRSDASHPIILDGSDEDADWTKQTWDIPAASVEELLAWLAGQQISLAEFRELPVYTMNVGKLRWLHDLSETVELSAAVKLPRPEGYPRRLPSGNLLVPARAEGAGGIIGDGLLEIGPEHPDYADWIAWMEQHGEQR